MTRTIHPRLTPARRRHLEQLADGQARRVAQRGPAGFACRKLGWCAFAAREIATGRIVADRDRPWYDENGVKLYEFLTDPWDGAEIITPEGRRVLGEGHPFTSTPRASLIVRSLSIWSARRRSSSARSARRSFVPRNALPAAAMASA